MNGARVGIVGGGMLGLTLAMRLRAAGHEVTVLEVGEGLGGLASAHAVGGYTWDRFYHVILQSDEHLMALLRELRLDDEVRWGRTRTGFFTGGRLHSLSSSLEFLRFPPLGPIEKLRLATTIIRASRIRDGRSLETIPALEWLTRWSGRRTVERLWLPLLRSKLGDNAQAASAAFIWAIIARMYAARRSGLKHEQFGYVEGGYATILDRIAGVLEGRGVVLRTRAAVAAVEGEGGGVRVHLSGTGPSLAFDVVVLTVPCPVIASLCSQLTSQERTRLHQVVYQGVVCASLLLRRPLGGFYVTNITDPGFPFTGVIEMSALVDRERFGGHSLVYLPRYLAQDDALWGDSDAEHEARFVKGLCRMYPDLASDDVVAVRVARARFVQAVSTLSYTDKALPPVETSIPGVFVVNSAQIANGTLNNNEIVGLANRKAEHLLRHLRGQASRAVA